MQLFAKKKIQVNEIAYLLFLDVVNFYSCETTMQMRYNDITKKYFYIGKKRFHGQFLSLFRHALMQSL